MSFNGDNFGTRAHRSQQQFQRHPNAAQTITVDSIVPKIRPSSSIKFFYPAEASQCSKYSMESNANPDEHDFVRPDEPRAIKSALNNLTNSFRYIPEDSCDSILSVDDAEDDEDDEEALETSGKSISKLLQGPSPGKSYFSTCN